MSQSNMIQSNIISKSIYLGNQLDNLDQKFDVYLKLSYKRREIGCNLDVLSVRYNLKTDNFLDMWMYNFIIIHSESNAENFLQDFARIFIISDERLRRVELYHQCRFQNKLFQDNVDKEIKSEKDKFIKEMIKRKIIFLDHEDLVVFPIPSLKLREFEVDSELFRHPTCDSATGHLGKRLPVCY